jgi:hypothetical protein
LRWAVNAARVIAGTRTGWKWPPALTDLQIALLF